jgi:hypothetical protein
MTEWRRTILAKIAEGPVDQRLLNQQFRKHPMSNLGNTCSALEKMGLIERQWQAPSRILTITDEGRKAMNEK